MIKIFPEIRVYENGTTGYRWEIVEQLNCDVTELITDMATSFNGEILVGGGHIKVFRINTKDPGEYRLTVVHRRAWEKDVPAEHSISLEGSF